MKSSFHKFTHRAYEQKEEANCIQLAATYMVTMVHMMNGRTKILLSPHIFIDGQCSNIDMVKLVVGDPNFGLQSIRDYPYRSFKSQYINGMQ